MIMTEIVLALGPDRAVCALEERVSHTEPSKALPAGKIAGSRLLRSCGVARVHS